MLSTTLRMGRKKNVGVIKGKYREIIRSIIKFSCFKFLKTVA
jgi:hypothetical protein